MRSSETRSKGVVTWKGNRNVSSLAGKPVRIRVRDLKDADLFAFSLLPPTRRGDFQSPSWGA